MHCEDSRQFRGVVVAIGPGGGKSLAQLCFASVVNLPANVSLLVASLDLQLVKLLRGAIRTADLSSRPRGAGGMGPAASFEPRRVIHPTPHFEPRPVVHPTPRFEPRFVERPLKTSPDAIPSNSAPCAPEQPRIGKSPILPPWKVRPWENPAPPAQVIKLAMVRPDIGCKGSIKGTIIDCFI